MYSNYGTIPSFPQTSSNVIPTQMSQSIDPRFTEPMLADNNDRIIGGGFLGPFILGGITGGLLAPAFYPRPYYPYPYPYYGPYYR